MENKYYRITAYHTEENISIIVDSNGKFEQLWEFSAYLITKGFEIIKVSKSETMKSINISEPNENKNNIILRAIDLDKPKIVEYKIDNQFFDAIQVADKIYIPKI